MKRQPPADTKPGTDVVVAVASTLAVRAKRLEEKFGCKQCGMIGCKCHEITEVTDTFAASLCKKCRADPCECEGSPVTRAVSGICTVCRRAAGDCICTSHVVVRQVLDVAVRERKFETRPYSDWYLGSLVNEGLNYYYSRDAEGLARWLRKALR